MRIASFITLALFIASITACGCNCFGPSSERKKELVEAKELLWEAGINPKTLRVDGKDINIDYETSKAINYDEQLMAIWGQIFGILQWYAKDDVIIINTVEDKPVATVTASVKDIKAFSKGRMSREEFLNKIKIKAK